MGILSYLKKQKVKIEFSIMLTKLTSSFRQIVEIYKNFVYLKFMQEYILMLDVQ